MSKCSSEGKRLASTSQYSTTHPTPLLIASPPCLPPESPSPSPSKPTRHHPSPKPHPSSRTISRSVSHLLTSQPSNSPNLQQYPPISHPSSHGTHTHRLHKSSPHNKLCAHLRSASCQPTSPPPPPSPIKPYPPNESYACNITPLRHVDPDPVSQSSQSQIDQSAHPK